MTDKAAGDKPTGLGKGDGPIGAMGVDGISPERLKALSPLDGRYAPVLDPLRPIFSEFGLIKYRVKVEVEWLIWIAAAEEMPEVPALPDHAPALMRQWVEDFSDTDAKAVKSIEASTRHDVKAVEYYLRDRLTEADLARWIPFVHLFCTSEDINNVSHSLMLRDGVMGPWLSTAEELLALLAGLVEDTKAIPMLSRTHGQPASPTTMGKELSVTLHRLCRQLEQLEGAAYLAKFSGAVGNYNAHHVVYPQIPWAVFAGNFLKQIGLEQNPTTTQIESHDALIEVFSILSRFNNILIDFDRDAWAYISMNYFAQRRYADEVGSSTMPHKINPIDFENSEANCALSTALLDFLSNKLPISRLQRDLSDSTAIRNIGMSIGYSYLAMRGTIAGLKKIHPNQDVILADVENQWPVLGEAYQSVMRKYGSDDAYEFFKEKTQGVTLDEAQFNEILQATKLSPEDRDALASLRPETYIGLAVQIAEDAVSRWRTARS